MNQEHVSVGCLYRGMSTSRYLREMPHPERQEALEDLIVAYMKEMLLMTEDEELPIDHSYFDLGLTSLRLVEARRHLEELLGIGIDATLLFNQPTIERLVLHLADALSIPATDGGIRDAG
jgi:acyl carrier protein